MQRILPINRDLFARSMVSKPEQGPTDSKKVRTKLAKRDRHERSKGQALIIVGRAVFGSFEMARVDNVL